MTLLERPRATPLGNPAGDIEREPLVMANLLPPEIAAGRHVRRIQKLAALAVLVSVVGVAGWDVVEHRATAQAAASLASAQQASTSLARQQGSFTELTRTQQQSAVIKGQLTTLMATDLPWWKVLPALRSAAPTGVTITSVNATMATPDAAAAPSSGTPVDPNVVGSVTVTGSAPDKAAVAGFVDALGRTPGVAHTLVSSVTAGSGSAYTFTLQTQITRSVLGGRWSGAGK